MDKDKLSAKEVALLAEARREAQARKEPPASAPAHPAAGTKPAPAAAEAKPTPSAAERLAQLMEDERAETLERKRRMRRYGIIVPSAILAVFTLWLLSAFRRRR
jgi:hypothetical protein